MLLAVAMVALAWVVPLTPVRRIIPSESAVALLVCFALLCTLFVTGRLT